MRLATILAANTTLKELDVSNNLGDGAWDEVGFAQELAVGLGTNGALEKLNISSNNIKEEALQRITELCISKGVVCE